MKANIDKSSKIRLCVIDSSCKIGIIAIELQGDGLEIKHEYWINTGLDFLNCMYISQKIYFSEYNNLYQISLAKSGSEEVNKTMLMKFESKIVAILEAGVNTKYMFLEDGLFYELNE